MNIHRRILTVGFSLLAIFAIGGCGGGSSPAPPPPPDTTAPTVSPVQAPPGTVNRIVTLTVTASDNVGVTEVRFFVDGVLLGNDATSPYSMDWDTSGETEGDHMLSAEAQDAAGNIGQSGGVIVTVRNMLQFAVAPNGEEQVPASDTQATAQATLMINLASGTVQGDMTITGLTATVAHIHDNFAGANGPILIALDQDAGDPSLFTVPAGAMLDAAGIDRLLAGALYINIHTAANPGGEIRGQILPDGFVLRFTNLAGVTAVPQVESIAGGRAAVTLDQVSGTLVVQAQVEGLDDATQAHVHEAYAGASGPVLISLSKDMIDPGHWFVEGATLNAAGLDAFAAGQLYVNVHSPANPAGEIRGQILPQGITVLFTELSGEQEVPPVDTNAAGLAALTFDEAGALLTLHVNTRGLNDPNGTAHLHLAYAGVNGPVEIALLQDGGNPAHWFAEEQVLSTTQLAALLAGATYVNVHSQANPGGEVRGQVILDNIIFAFGRLEGSQRVPVVDTMASGTFAVTIDPVAATLVAHANTSGVDNATVAHLHDGYAGTNGGVAIGLTRDPTEVKRWSVVDAPLDANQLAALRAGRFYVNIHTPAHPGGEIRGQVAPPPVEVLFTSLSGNEEVPALASAASGIAASTVDRETGTVTLHLNASGADADSPAHIHLGYAGQNGGVMIALQQDMADAGHWSVIGAQLDDTGLADYLGGRVYVNLHTMANPGGEIRGQIAPRDIQIVFSPMDGAQVVPPVTTAASGMAATTINLKTRRFVAFVNGAGVDDATSAGIHLSGLNENGAEVLALQQTPMLPGQWSGSSEPLAAATFSSYRAGRLYAQVATPGQPNGEIRGQVVPPNAADFDDQAPTVDLTSLASPVSGTVTLEATATDDQGVVEVRFLVNGVLINSDVSAPYSIDWDTTMVADGQVTLTAEAEDFAGNVGVSADVLVTVQNGSSATLSQIQTQVFTPICSGCHSGAGGVLPGVMNLTAGNSFTSLVNVASIQVATIDRVEPGDPDNSYLIQKLMGTAAVGDRMPQGGTPLDQATMDMIRQWITDGAAND